jgi:CRP-like cAMP-binding protein
MHQNLKEILDKIGHFSEEDCSLFEKYFTTIEVNKNEILLAEGEVCTAVYYLLSGAVYQYTLQDVDENIIDLHLENEWFLNYSSFVSQKPSHTTIKVFADAYVLKLSMQAIHSLIAKSPAFLQLGKVLDNGLSRTHFFDNDMTPLQKYNYLLENRPAIIQAFPLKMIASYLKITPETLSRVRGNIS